MSSVWFTGSLTMPPDEEVPLRRRSEQEALARYELMEEITRAIDAGVNKAFAALAEHMKDVHAHQDANTAERQQLVTLWQERSEMRGLLRIGIPVLGLAGPIIAVLVAHFLK